MAPGSFTKTAAAGTIATVALVSIAASVRLLSGRSLEGIGAHWEKVLVGDTSEKARAAMDTRSRFTSDPHLLHIAASEGRVNSQIHSIADDLRAMRKRELDGSSMIVRDGAFDVDSVFEQIVVRVAAGVRQAFAGGSESQDLDRLREAIHTRGGYGDPRGGR